MSDQQTIDWLRGLAKKGGKGVVNNIDARCLGRIADELERLTSVAQAQSRAYEAARANLREAWDALAMIRETVETLAPSGSVKAAEHLDGPTLMHEADALVAGIMAIASPGSSTDQGSRLTFCEVCNGNTMHRRASIVDGVQTFECQRCALSSTTQRSPWATDCPNYPGCKCDDICLDSGGKIGCGDPNCKDPNCTYGKGKPRCQNCGDPIAHGIYCGTCREMGCSVTSQDRAGK